MSVAALALALGVALAGIAMVLNHVYARIAVVELTLNEGLPPGFSPSLVAERPGRPQISPAHISDRLGSGVHIFLSRGCLACQRLIDELDQFTIATEASIHLHYVDRPRPVAQSAAQRQNAELSADQADLAKAVGADPLPYTVSVGEHGLLAQSVSPTLALVVSAARDAGIAARVPTVA